MIAKSAPTNDSPRQKAKVIMFRPKQAVAQTNASPAEVVTQQRLQRILELMNEEARVVRELREQTLALQSDIASGAIVEEGALDFDTTLRTVRRIRAKAQHG